MFRGVLHHVQVPRYVDQMPRLQGIVSRLQTRRPVRVHL
jgi:hypothetical protein